MGTLSIWHWLIVLAVVLILFGGRGKVSQLMGDFGKGLQAFRKGMKEDAPFDEGAGGTAEPQKGITAEKPASADPAKQRDRAAHL
jgi:sec-independent protein translocase protein TatA